MRNLIFASTLLALSLPAVAGDFFVDPTRGSASGDGSEANPWNSLQAVFDGGLIESRTYDTPYQNGAVLRPRNAGGPITAGDTIWLGEGDYGSLDIASYYNAAPITLAALPDHTPRFRQVKVTSSANWTLRGLDVSAEHGSGNAVKTLVDVVANGHRGPVHDITVADSTLRSTADSSNWGLTEWNSLAANGISAAGRNITLTNNRLHNVNFGISLTASDSLVEGNTVENFAGDGMRGLGDHSTFRNNTIKNAYSVNGNHDDGFQSWSRGPGGVGTGVVTGVTVSGNTFISYTDPDQPFKGKLQGIGMFDGGFDDWVIENNVVITDAYHGISLYSVTDSRIVNNTVIDLDENFGNSPWLSVRNDDSANNTIRNNLVQKLVIKSAAANTADHNLVIRSLGDLAALFADLEAYDLRLVEGAAAVDAGSALLAPNVDRLGTLRPQGGGIDIGAFERAVPEPASLLLWAAATALLRRRTTR